MKFEFFPRLDEQFSHQWLCELKRRNSGAIAGVYFRIPDDKRVWRGHCGKYL